MRVLPVVLSAVVSAALFTLSAPAHAQWEKAPARYEGPPSFSGNGTPILGSAEPGIGTACDWYGGTSIYASLSAVGYQQLRFTGNNGSTGLYKVTATVEGNISGVGQMNSNGVAGGRSKIEVISSDSEADPDSVSYISSTLEDETRYYLNPTYQQTTGALDLIVLLSGGPFTVGQLADLPSVALSANSSAGPSHLQSTSPGAHTVTRAWAHFEIKRVALIP